MRGSTVNNQGGFLTSNERRILRNYQEGSGNSRGSSFQARLDRISQPIGASTNHSQNSANIARVRNLLATIRNGVTASTMALNG